MFNHRSKKAVAAIVCLTVISATYAGWSIHRATDTTRVDLRKALKGTSRLCLVSG